MVCITSSSMLCPITSLPCRKNIKRLLHFQSWPWQRVSVKTPISDASQGHLGTNTHQTSPFDLCLPHTFIHSLRAAIPFSSTPNHSSEASAAASNVEKMHSLEQLLTTWFPNVIHLRLKSRHFSLHYLLNLFM